MISILEYIKKTKTSRYAKFTPELYEDDKYLNFLYRVDKDIEIQDFNHERYPSIVLDNICRRVIATHDVCIGCMNGKDYYFMFVGVYTGMVTYPVEIYQIAFLKQNDDKLYSIRKMVYDSNHKERNTLS